MKRLDSRGEKEDAFLSLASAEAATPPEGPAEVLVQLLVGDPPRWD